MNSQKEGLHKNEFDNDKLKVLNVLLIFTVVGGFIFAVINYQSSKVTLASMELAVSITSAILLIYLKKSEDIKHFQRITLSFVLMFCFIMLYAFTRKDISVTVYIFALLIPLFSHLLLGNRIGLVVTAAILGFSYVIFFYRYHNHFEFQQAGPITNIITVPLLVWGIAYSYERANESAKQKLSDLARRDFLTGLYNRTMLNDLYYYKLNHSIRNKQAFSILVADLDHFKKINDLYGHKAGDQFIKRFAEILKQHSGPNSACFRIGGEEFCVILSNTDLTRCHKIAENIRQATEKIMLTTNKSTIPVTVSIGIADCHSLSCEMSELLDKADQKLYQAKQQGRNQVVS